jgi:hypothetical protein
MHDAMISLDPGRGPYVLVISTGFEHHPIGFGRREPNNHDW